MGNVADPDGPHFDDQLEDWLDGRYRKLLFERSDILADAEKTVKLSRSATP